MSLFSHKMPVTQRATSIHLPTVSANEERWGCKAEQSEAKGSPEIAWLPPPACAHTLFHLLAWPVSSTWASPECAGAKPQESSLNLLFPPYWLLNPNFLITNFLLLSSLQLSASHHSPSILVPGCSYNKCLDSPRIPSALKFKCTQSRQQSPGTRGSSESTRQTTFLLLILLSGLRPNSAGD